MVAEPLWCDAASTWSITLALKCIKRGSMFPTGLGYVRVDNRLWCQSIVVMMPQLIWLGHQCRPSL